MVSRFLSPDPVLQFPDYTQGLNPYAYALNNPLRYVDPDGYSLVGNLIALSFNIALTSVGMPWLGLAAYSLIMTIDQSIESRGQIHFIETFAHTFIIGAITMNATGIIGKGFDGLALKENAKIVQIELKRALAHATFNGAMRMAQGGKFEHGFMSGFVSSLGGSYMQANAGGMSFAAQVATSAAIGGTTEALGGGKFANGAVTGAYVMMFNHLGGEEGDPPNLEDGIPQPPTEVADALRVELINMDPSLKISSSSDTNFGLGDALTIAGEIYPNPLFQIVGTGLTFYEAFTQISNGQYMDATWTLVQEAGGTYTIIIKGAFALSQTRYMQMGMGNAYYQDFRYNMNRYNRTGSSKYRLRAEKAARQMETIYINLQRPN